MRQGRFAHARDVLDQQVAARDQAGDRETDLIFLAEDDAADLCDDFFYFPGHAARIRGMRRVCHIPRL